VLLLAGALIQQSTSCGGSTLSDHDHQTHDHGTGDNVTEPEAAADVQVSVKVVDGTVVGGVSRFKVSVGQVIVVTIDADMIDQVHLHVYDEVIEVGPGIDAEMVVWASVPGVFEAELHGSGLRVFELQVS